MDNNLPERKIIRKRGFDYSVSGAYFITICTQDRRNILSTVGDGASTSREDDYAIHLTPYGKIVEKYLLSSENIKNVKVDKYVIMPNHIHVIFFIENEDIASVASLNDFRDVEVSNPFRGERDHREHTAKRCWNAVPYEYDGTSYHIGIQTDV